MGLSSAGHPTMDILDFDGKQYKPPSDVSDIAREVRTHGRDDNDFRQHVAEDVAEHEKGFLPSMRDGRDGKGSRGASPRVAPNTSHVERLSSQRSGSTYAGGVRENLSSNNVRCRR